MSGCVNIPSQSTLNVTLPVGAAQNGGKSTYNIANAPCVGDVAKFDPAVVANVAGSNCNPSATPNIQGTTLQIIFDFSTCQSIGGSDQRNFFEAIAILSIKLAIFALALWKPSNGESDCLIVWETKLCGICNHYWQLKFWLHRVFKTDDSGVMMIGRGLELGPSTRLGLEARLGPGLDHGPHRAIFCCLHAGPSIHPGNY